MKGKCGILSLLNYPNIPPPLAWRKALILFTSSIKALTPFPVLLHTRDVPFCVIFIFIGKISFYFCKITQKGTSLMCNFWAAKLSYRYHENNRIQKSDITSAG